MKIQAIAAAFVLLMTVLPAPVGRTSGAEQRPVVGAQPAAPTTVSGVVTTADLGSVLGRSGNLRAYWAAPGAPLDPVIEPLAAAVRAHPAGVQPLGVLAPDGAPMSLLPLETFTASASMRYRTGRWPTAGRAAVDPRYAPPTGFISVTEENQSTAVSKRFALRDFLTHDQQDVWPKVLVLQPRLVDKLELIGEALEQRGLPSRIHVMSGFRTPQYNALGVGEGGRASFSRHTYGDAADIFVDGDGDGRMDDLDRDGRVTVKDSRVLLAIAEGVESEHPEMVGGMSAYRATDAHGPFVHVDARGTRARW